MNKRSLALTKEQYIESVKLLREGFVLDGVIRQPNPRIATIVVMQGCLGLRIGDCLKLKMSSFVKDGNLWRLDIVEQKTKKKRVFKVPLEIYNFIQGYAYQYKIGYENKLFDISVRQVQRHLKYVFIKMGLDPKKYGTHSYRRFFAVSVFVNNNKDIRLVQELLQHSSVQVTQLYISVFDASIEEALNKTVSHLI